jgi:hypothetical protein
MCLKRPAAIAILFLSFTFIALGLLNVPTNQAHAQGGGASLSKEQAGVERDRPPRPASTGPHIAANSVGNGDFEAGPDGTWTEYSAQGWPLIVNSAVLTTVGVTPHSGNWAVWLGGDNDEIAYISQTVTVPISNPVLSFWEWIGSAETGCGYDVGSVRIDDTVVTSFDLCTNTNTGGWVRRTQNLSAYAGQTVELQFLVTTNGSDNSNLFIDDVAISEQSFAYSVHLPIILGNFCSGYDYFEDFSDPNSGWYPGIDGYVTHVYTNGEYQIRFDYWDQDWLTTPDLVIPASNYRVEADMRNDWVNSGTYGLIFGVHWYQASDNEWHMDQGYQVMISPNYQEYFVNKIVGNSWPTLRNWTYSGAIRKNSATNHLRVDRIGTSIRIYINGTAMPAITDASYTGSGRDAGISAHSYDTFPVDMRFDNFHATTCVQ